MLLCYDKLFPEAARALALDGAEIDRAACRPGRSDRHHPAPRHPRRPPDAPLRPARPARARSRTRSSWVSSNQTGPLGRRCASSARAKVVDPDGARARAHGRRRGLSPSRASTRDAIDGLARGHRPPRRPPARAYGPARRPSRASAAVPPGRAVLMCGIVAEHGGSDPAALERMLERIAHRGPDDRGSVQVGRQLARAPAAVDRRRRGRRSSRCSTADGDVWLVGNGEVYNHENVRARLDGREIAHDLRQRGRAAPARRVRARGARRLNGMFAFVMAGPTTAASSPPATRSASSRCTGRSATASVRFASRDARLRPATGSRSSSRSRPAARGRRRTAWCASPPRSRRTLEPLPTGGPARAGTRDVLVARRSSAR